MFHPKGWGDPPSLVFKFQHFLFITFNPSLSHCSYIYCKVWSAFLSLCKLLCKSFENNPLSFARLLLSSSLEIFIKCIAFRKKYLYFQIIFTESAMCCSADSQESSSNLFNICTCSLTLGPAAKFCFIMNAQFSFQYFA